MRVKSWSQFINALIVRKVSFAVTFFFVFLTTYAVLAWLDFLPEPVSELSEESIEKTEENKAEIILDEPIEDKNTEEKNAFAPVELPESIIFDSLDKTVTVLNPKSREVNELDTALLDGAVRHPDSATLNQVGTVFILAHSSYLPSVVNKNFQAFNGIQNLKWGDIVRVRSEGNEYVYRVEKVYKAMATDTTVPIAGDAKRLVLATCNSFGSVDDRYIVEAELKEVLALKT